MNSTKQCVNSEPCEVTVHARKKKKKKAENVDVTKRGIQTQVQNQDLNLGGQKHESKKFQMT